LQPDWLFKPAWAQVTGLHPASNEYEGGRGRKKALALRMKNVSEWAN
jgi:hypothetical protein